MGRLRKNYICPVCNKQGYLENNPTKTGKYWRVVHYDSLTKKRHRHYVDHMIRDQKRYQRNGDDISIGTFDLKIDDKRFIPLIWIFNLTTRKMKSIEVDLQKIDRIIHSRNIE